MRKKRPLDRNTDIVRDTRLVVIASEDRYAVKQYFEFFHSRRIQFQFLETTDGRSAPEHVLERINQFLDEFDIGEGDHLWLVSDTDHWIEPNHIQNLVQVIRECRDKGIGVAISRPCFELWLLLHFAEFPTNEVTCADLVTELQRVVGFYNKRKVYNLPIDNDAVAKAIERSKANQTDSGEIPDQVETRMHQIIEEMVEMGIITINKEP